MEASAELWRSLWPRFGRVFAIELALAMGVIGAAWITLTLAAAPAMYKARFSEVWYYLLPGKLEATERIALDMAEAPAASVGKRETSDKVTQRLEGTTIILSGVLRGQPAYEMRIAPVVGADGAVALWKCTSTTLTGRWMPSQCRPGRSG